MTRIEQTFQTLAGQGKKGFVAYITAGDPSLKGTVEIVHRLEEAGVDVVELGIPFSDPLADGKVNQMSAGRALDAGATPGGVWDCIAAIRKKSEIPIICYTYLNPMCSGGFARNAKAAAQAGVDGLLLLDLPIEEAAPYDQVMVKHGLDRIRLVTPTSPVERIKKIVEGGSGFAYCVSRTGVTGAQKSIASGARDLVRRIKRHTSLPVALGFGVSEAAQAREAVEVADAVVVGSAIVSRFHDAPHTSAGRRQAAKWVAGLVRAVKGA